MPGWRLIPVTLLCLTISGCVVRTYSVTKERPDQDLNTGNRGFVAAQSIPPAPADRKPMRSTKVIELELCPFIKFNKKPSGQIAPVPQKKTEDSTLAITNTDRGLFTQTGSNPVLTEQTRYTVQPRDTLQKIAIRFYGLSEKWTMIYAANRGILKGPDKIQPGQVIIIPVLPADQGKAD